MSPGEIPTFADLEEVGHDAGALLDAIESELEIAVAMALHKEGRRSLAQDLKRLRKLRDRWFGDAA